MKVPEALTVWTLLMSKKEGVWITRNCQASQKRREGEKRKDTPPTAPVRLSLAAKIWGIALPQVLLMGIFCSGCSAGLGVFCHNHADCQPGLRCSAAPGKRGICTYPEGVKDVAFKFDAHIPSKDASRYDTLKRDLSHQDHLMDQTHLDTTPLDQKPHEGLLLDKKVIHDAEQTDANTAD